MQFLIFAVVLILLALQIDAEVKKLPMYGYVSKDKKHMTPACRSALESRMSTRCRRPAFYPGDGEPVDFDGCRFTCRYVYGTTTAEQRVHLTDGLPCGPHGEICKNGECVGGMKPSERCDVSLVPKSPYESGHPPNS
uniref:Putative ticsk ixostatin n=3 Tax=Ixodes ricinus TaxID=34613 RepID=A0A147BI10_IXORI